MLPLCGLAGHWAYRAALLLVHAAGHDAADGQCDGREHEESCDGPWDCRNFCLLIDLITAEIFVS